MFDRIRSSFSSKSRSTSTSESRRPSVWQDVPTVNEPETRPSSDSATKSRPSTSDSSSELEPFSSGNNASRARRSSATPSTDRARASADSDARLREVLWQNGLWDRRHSRPRGSIVRPKSQSVSVVHPTLFDHFTRTAAPYP